MILAHERLTSKDHKFRACSVYLKFKVSCGYKVSKTRNQTITKQNKTKKLSTVVGSVHYSVLMLKFFCILTPEIDNERASISYDLNLFGDV